MLGVTRSLCLITGGAGFLGINLCRFLLSRGLAVRTLDIAPFDYPERDVVDAITGDVRDPEAVGRAMRDVAFVVHAAAALPLSPSHEILTTAIDGTRTVLEGALREGARRVVFISSTAVYGIPDHHPIRESDRLHGVGPYGEGKIEAERICGEYRTNGLCVPVIRPKTFVGPERLGVFELLYDWAFSGRNFPLIGRGDNHYQLLDVEDLCRAIELCATADEARANDVFNVAADRFGTMRENIQCVLDRAGHGKRAIPLPAAPVIAALELLELLRLSPLYQWIYETAGQESFVSTELIRERLGFVPTHSNCEALVRNYEWYVAHRDQIAAQPGTTHRVRWRRGVLAVAKLFF
jgi:nucleoside-diphosphate-sugar epimerase